MSMSIAVNKALLGLARNAQATSVVSSNLSNASEPGYARRVIVGDQILRVVDPALLSDRRLSDAEMAAAQTMQDYAQRLDALAGSAEDPGSLQNLMSIFDSALLSAAADPASEQRLNAVAVAGSDLAQAIGSASGEIQAARADADTAIAKDLAQLNALLEEAASLNQALARAQPGTASTASLFDQRQKVIDAVAEIVPIRTAPRDQNGIALYTTNGAILLDGQPATVGFTPTPVIAAQMTEANGLLGGLTINGRAVSSGPKGPLSGGRLGAAFEARDVMLPEAQARLDGIAYDLIERFGAGGPDATIAPGQIGLFSELGAPPGPPPVPGLSERLIWNPAVAPGSTDLWKLRDGLGATAPGEVGDAALLNALSDSLNALRAPTDPALGGSVRSARGQFAAFGASIEATRILSEDALTRFSARNTALREIEFSQGVDSDVELQRLLEIEQNYAANAQVLRSVDEMLNQLLSI
ncbi:flagellar hook-associated protein 1 FlgK [Roseivivax lentus]|uniref:Flagellar hook-associated protein 1 n=1 Tax=Roseivivax lentus TaxID=633194 RepID=A0A1N7JLP8_9RHOB|nr:flagellar basal body rod C-terminal domain-containing protein [Roseivivax lentus]SIS50258.1 flagellar hook-associated protein 1 FlgK [Roseivivax lentus]